MKLYFFHVAPNPTKVRLYLAEKAAGGAEIEIEPILVNLLEGEQHSTAHLDRNPFGTLPVLELDDGTRLIESLTIIEYIEECHPEPILFGSDRAQRAQLRQLERLRKVRKHRPYLDIRIVIRERFRRGHEMLTRYVHRDISRQAVKLLKQHSRLDAGAAAEFDETRVRTD